MLRHKSALVENRNVARGRMGIGHAICSHALCMKLGWPAAIDAESMAAHRRQEARAELQPG